MSLQEQFDFGKHSGMTLKQVIDNDLNLVIEAMKGYYDEEKWWHGLTFKRGANKNGNRLVSGSHQYDARHQWSDGEEEVLLCSSDDASAY